ncbi:hypothetical protein HHI36_015251 [Cryptolaemus montrouzieri]|uniref:Uncharacterized protein n=1 Tax=Cryptolaemus montrouzieri TaxID=559131 RepID=A0ABD2N518_9CUCU
MRDQLNLVSELYDIYKSLELKNLRKSLKLKYKLEVNKAKIKGNDIVILKSNNKQKTMWDLIDSKRFISRRDDSDNDVLLCKNLPDNISFSFREVSYNEIRDIIGALKNSSSRDIYDLQLYQ